MRNKQCLRFTLKSAMCVMVLLLAFVFSLGSIVYAQQTQADVKLPQVQKFTIKNANLGSVSQKGMYELTALDLENPMPEGSKEGKYSFTIDGDGQAVISMTYFHGGVYKYRICQTTAQADSYGYDRRIYTVTVYVENGQNGELTTQVVVENEKKENAKTFLLKTAIQERMSRDADTGSQNPSGDIEDVKTGDNTSLTVWIAMLVLASAGIAAILILKRKAENDKEK